MAVENLYASSLTAGSVSGSSNALGSTSGTWTTDTGNTNWSARFAMGDPTSGDAANGTHSITIRVRKEAGQSGTPTVSSITLYEGGVSLGAIGAGGWSVTSGTGEDITATFAGSLVGNVSSLEVEIATSAAGGSPSARSAVQLDYIQWNGDFIIGAKDGSTTGSFAFAGSASGAFPVYSDWSAVVQGTTAASTPNQGSATGGFAFAGTAAGEAPPNAGSGTGGYAFAGAASGSITQTGVAAGDVFWTASATGSEPAGGNVSSGSVAWAGTASGVSPTVGANEGTAASSYNFTGASQGARESAGSATGSTTWTGSTSGEVPANEGQAAGGYLFAGSADGEHQPAGSAIGAASWAGASAGQHDPQGSASSGLVWTATAVGGHPARSGAASGSFLLAGAATGSRSSEGSVLEQVAWSAVAAGAAPVIPDLEGTVEATVSWVGVTTGARESLGAAEGYLAYGSAATGEGIDPTFMFEPPTYRKVVEHPPLIRKPRYSLTESMSVVRVDGTLTSRKTPTARMLQEAGTEGIDYFIGGHEYVVSQSIADELVAAGYDVTQI